MTWPTTIEPALRLLGIAGLALFAMSGALAAARQRLDIVGAGFFATITAIGGGTLRDLLIGAPVFWIGDATPILLCSAAAVAVWLVPLRRWPVRALDWQDGAGLAAFSVHGTAKALDFGAAPLSAAAMGVVTGCLGGIVRDVVAGVPSIMLRNELYVTAALAAVLAFVVLRSLGLGEQPASIVAAAIGFALRGAAIHWRLALPRHRG